MVATAPRSRDMKATETKKAGTKPTLVLFFSQFDFTVVKRLDDRQALAAHASRLNHVTPVLERFLDDEAHSHQFSTGLPAEINDAFRRIAVGKEIVDEQR